jgi:NADH-quinone oxidoreductase subunit A
VTQGYTPVEYLPILVMMAVATAFGAGTLLIGALVRLRRPYREKLLPYESGKPPVGEPKEQFNVRYYIIAILFVIFDVEIVFLYPWAMVYRRLGLFALIEMMVFIVILVVGYVYAWRKDSFE